MRSMLALNFYGDWILPSVIVNKTNTDKALPLTATTIQHVNRAVSLCKQLFYRLIRINYYSMTLRTHSNYYLHNHL